MRPRRLSLAPLLLPLWLLSACSQPATPVVVRARPPASLLTCGDPPGRPDLSGGRWDQAAGNSITAIIDWGMGCWSNLAKVREIEAAP